MKGLAEFLGDVARPFSIITTSFAASYAIISIAHRVMGFGEGAAFIGVVLAGVGALYWGKAWENTKGK